MIPNPRPQDDRRDRDRVWRGRVLTALGALGLSATAWVGAWAGAGRGDGLWDLPFGTWLYSTAESPREYRGPRPTLQLAMNEATTTPARAERLLDLELMRAQAEAPAAKADSREAGSESARPSQNAEENVPRVARGAARIRPEGLARESGSTLTPALEASSDLIARAKQAIADCQARYLKVRDYTCTFHKRERIDGRLTQSYVMSMKARTQPHSIYFKFQRPKKGREAIYVSGRHAGKIVVHDVGLGKLIAGTMKLDPKGSMAMEENRHPVTEAGIGALIESVTKHWAVELSPADSRITFTPNARVGNHLCTMIESVHPRKHPSFLFHMVKLYIDDEHGLPIRFEAYDWPSRTGGAPELIEEYSYLNLRTNVGLRDQDFDAANPQYSYGRF